MNKVIVKVIKKNDMDLFEKELEMFYNTYIDTYEIEMQYATMTNSFSAILIARRKWIKWLKLK